jgi:hypothetical protein
MRSTIKAVVLGLATMALAATVNAQGSSYNFIGFGEPVVTRLAHLEGLGGGGTGLADGRMVSDLNPAAWSWLTRARLETSFRFERVNTEFNGLTAVGNDFRFSGLSFGAPVGGSMKAAIALGFAPLTNASYEIKQTDAQASRSYISQGGISLGYIGASIMATPGLAIGGKLDLLFGNVRHLSALTFEGDNSPATSQFQRDYSVNGLRGSFGVLLHGDSLVPSLGAFTLGLGYSTSSSLTVKRRTSSLSAINDTTLESEAEGFYPGSISAGLTYTFDRRYRVLADVVSQDFSKAVLYADDASIGDPNMQAFMRTSVGFEKVANMSSEFGSEGGVSRWALRAGVFFASTPFAPSGTGGVGEIGGSLGVGIPMSAESLLDLSLTVGQRTPTNANSGASDLFMRFGLSLGLAEKWFVPTRKED